MNNEIAALNPTRAIYSVIGNICNNPEILRNPEVILGARDYPQDFHKVVFGAIHNLSIENVDVKDISPVDIDNYLASYPTHYATWEKGDGPIYIEDAKRHANKGTFDSDYDRIKKHSLLRNFVENGIDVTDIYDYKSQNLKDLTEGSEKLDTMTASEIIEHYSMKFNRVRDDWNIDVGTVKDFKAGDNIRGLLKRLRENPEMGFPFRNGFYNTLFRGMRKGKFVLRSGATGTGKTRQAIADMCSVSCSHIYETGRGWQSFGPSYPALLISTELEQEEVQVLMLAFITGISDSVIRNGDYDAGTEKRLEEGMDILEAAPFFVSYIEDFSIADIEMKIEQHIISEGVEYVAFDYIQMVPKLSKTMQAAFGQSLREDQILVYLSAAIKNLASKYQVFIESSTQLNRGSKEVENRDASSLRGGLATADKIDHGALCFKVGKQDREAIKHILENNGFNEDPNFSHWVYKNRAGIDHVIIWTVMDLGTMREKTLFITDYDYNLISDLRETHVDFVTSGKEDEAVRPEAPSRESKDLVF